MFGPWIKKIFILVLSPCVINGSLFSISANNSETTYSAYIC